MMGVRDAGRGEGREREERGGAGNKQWTDFLEIAQTRNGMLTVKPSHHDPSKSCTLNEADNNLGVSPYF